MPLDPGLQSLLEAMIRYDMMGLTRAGSAQAARKAFRSVTVDARPAELVLAVGAVEDDEFEGPAGPLRYRAYTPEHAPEGIAGPDGTLPTILFLHGGGWVIGDIDTHDNQARRLCRETGAVVVSAEYRLAPEAPFPAAVDDAWTATRWLSGQLAAGAFGGDPARLVLAGDSAGGNLAAVCARRARDAVRAGDGPAVAAQLLIYPAVDFVGSAEQYASREENAVGKLLTGEDLIWLAEQYLTGGAPLAETAGGGPDLADPDLSPLRAGDLSDLAPAVVVTAEFDPLRDEGAAYAAALAAAGTPVTHELMAGMIHGFFDLGPVSPAVEAAASRTCTLLRELLTDG